MIDPASDLQFEQSISSSIEANRCDIFKVKTSYDIKSLLNPVNIFYFKKPIQRQC